MSITTLTRSGPAPATPWERAHRSAPAGATVVPAKKPRRLRRRRSHDGTSAVAPDARVIDLQVRSMTLWPRAYR